MRKLYKFIIIYAVCAALLLCFAVSVSAHETSADTDQVLNLLAELNIMNGDPDGDLRLGDYVTRAEFTKMAVAGSDFRHSAASNLSVSPFYDTPHTHWAAPYVRVGVTNGLVSGYPDASFRPENNVTYEEGVTIMLRVLGYSDNDFGAAWPSGQLGMAESLDMTDNILNTEIGSPMTRGDVAALIYNTLRCNKKDTQVQLVSIFDVNFIEDVTLISTSREDSSIPGDEVFTDSGSYKIRSGFDYGWVGMKGDLALKNNKTVVTFFPDEGASPDEKYVVYSILGDDVVVYKDGAAELLSIPDGAAAYDGAQRTTFAAVKPTLEMGDIINIRRTNGNIDYVLFEKGNMMGPYTVSGSSSYISETGISASTRISRGGSACSLSDIQSDDILYYVPELDMAFVYNTKITGVYEKASPNKDNPTEIVVSGETYKVEGAQAFIKLSSGGSLNYGDTVTLLLGRTNDVADVVTSGIEYTEIAGYAVATGTKTYTSGDLKDYSGYYIKIITPEGEAREYTCSSDYEDYKNSVVSLSINNGTATARVISDRSGVYGTFRTNPMRLGDDIVSSDVQILDVGTTDKNRQSLYTKIYPSRIDGVNLAADKILYAHKDASGEIDKLILSDATGDSYTFGVATSVKNMGGFGTMASGAYTYIVNGIEQVFNSASAMYPITSGVGIRLSSAQNPDIMSNLNEIDGAISITSETALTANGKTYAIAPDVQVYEKEYSSSTLYRMIPISDIINSDSHSLYAYYDKPPASGGRVRIIIAVKSR